MLSARSDSRWCTIAPSAAAAVVACAVAAAAAADAFSMLSAGFRPLTIAMMSPACTPAAAACNGNRGGRLT
jgi:hypothetical protein